MSWKDEYKRALVDFMAKHADLVAEDPSYYGYMDKDWLQVKRHLENDCAVDYDTASEIYDVDWREFNGTFNDEDDTRQGVEVRFSCKCGRVVNRQFRYTHGMAEVIRAITED